MVVVRGNDSKCWVLPYHKWLLVNLEYEWNDLNNKAVFIENAFNVLLNHILDKFASTQMVTTIQKQVHSKSCLLCWTLFLYGYWPIVLNIFEKGYTWTCRKVIHEGNTFLQTIIYFNYLWSTYLTIKLR